MYKRLKQKMSAMTTFPVFRPTVADPIVFTRDGKSTYLARMQTWPVKRLQPGSPGRTLVICFCRLKYSERVASTTLQLFFDLILVIFVTIRLFSLFSLFHILPPAKVRRRDTERGLPVFFFIFILYFCLKIKLLNFRI